MRYLALASDYDGTLAHDGLVNEQTIDAIERLIHSGRRLILVTGRELPDLRRRVYRATPLGRKALAASKERIRELFLEVVEGR